nr:11887_t:CDS:2 [Entrophospora candida]
MYHLSGPIPKLDGGGYRTFEELYDAETAEEFRPSKESQEMGMIELQTIPLGSSRSYKSSKVPGESIYDAEMYRILVIVNQLRKIHGLEITGQMHPEKVCKDTPHRNYITTLPFGVWIMHFSREDDIHLKTPKGMDPDLESEDKSDDYFAEMIKSKN